MVVELEAETLGARVDLVAVNPSRKRGLLQFLLDGLRLERGDPVGAYESTGMHEARQLVAGEERLLERRVSRDRQMLGVRKYRLDELLGVALFAQDRRSVLRMLVKSGVDLVVEVVQDAVARQSSSSSPELPGIPTAASTASACRRSGSACVYWVSVSQAGPSLRPFGRVG